MLGDAAAFEILDYADVPFMNQAGEHLARIRCRACAGSSKPRTGSGFYPGVQLFFSGALKNLTYLLSRPVSDTEPQVLAGKPTAISGISPGMSGTGLAQDNLVTLLSFLNMQVMNVPRLVIPNVR